MNIINAMNIKPLACLRAAILAVVVMGVASVFAQAEPKIAVVNLKTVFDGYYKTKQSDALVKDRQADYTKERKRMEDDYKKANDEYRKLSDSATDQAVSADERDKRKKDAESKLQEIREIEQSARQFDSQFRTQITDQINRMRDKILQDIREVVNSKAKTAGYTLVLDTAAMSADRTPIVLFTSGSPDLTDDVLKDLNDKAPPGALTTTTNQPPTAPADTNK
jgi:Skp family chaperone for outer membrane proteins